MNWSHNYTAEAAATTAAKHNQKKKHTRRIYNKNAVA